MVSLEFAQNMCNAYSKYSFNFWEGSSVRLNAQSEGNYSPQAGLPAADQTAAALQDVIPQQKL